MLDVVLSRIDQVTGLTSRAVDWTPAQSLPPLGSTVCFVAVARSGAPEGHIQARFSHADCVWYQAVEKANGLKDQISNGMSLPRAAFQEPDYVPGTLFPVQPGTRQGRLGLIKKVPPVIDRSTAPIVLDVSGASITLTPSAQTVVDCKKVSVNYLEHDAKGNDVALYQEWIIEPGEQLLCYGSLQRVNGVLTLVPDASGDVLISTRPKSQLAMVGGPGRDIVVRERRMMIVLAVVGTLVGVVGVGLWLWFMLSRVS